MKSFLLLICLFLLYGCMGGYQSPVWDGYHERNYNNLVEIRRLAEEQASLIKDKTTDFELLEQKIGRATLIMIDQQNNCNRIYRTSSYFDCSITLRLVASKSAEMEVITADYFAKNGMKDKAKEMYRNIIITYVGDAYKSYVKQAEFGLKDLEEK